MVRAHAGGDWGAVGELELEPVGSCQSSAAEPRISPAPFVYSFTMCWIRGNVDMLLGDQWITSVFPTKDE